jgi:hypothetical protein
MMIFFFGISFAMVVGRKIGWALSRNLLYSSGLVVCIIICLLWSVGIAFGLRHLILSAQPGWLVKIFGYGAGAYVSVPNYGLVDTSTIPAQERARHDFLIGVPPLMFAVASVVFAFAVSH